MKSFSYLPDLLFIFSTELLFSSAEAKVKCLFPLLSSINPSTSSIIRYSGFTLYFLNHEFFYCDLSNIINTNIFV